MIQAGVLDVTLRDGSFVNAFALDSVQVVELASLLNGLGLAGIEVGYFGGLPHDHGGVIMPGAVWDLSPQLLCRLCRSSDTPVVCMLHPGRPNRHSLEALRDCGLGMVRVPMRPTDPVPNEIGELSRMAIRVSLNLILGSWWSRDHLIRAAREGMGEGAAMIYVADTVGSMLPRDVEVVIADLVSAVDVPIGFHAHDSLGNANSNSLAARRAGARLVDSSAFGIGRDARNARTEAFLSTSASRLLISRGERIVTAFGVNPRGVLWPAIAAALDLSPACVDLLRSFAISSNVPALTLASVLLDGSNGDRPLTQAQLAAALTAVNQP